MARDKKESRTNPDGKVQTLTIRLPAKVHIFAAVFLVSLGCVAFFAIDVLNPILGILAILAAYYAAFYARQAIHSSRERERRIETLNVSRLYSSSPIANARVAIATRFNQILESQLGSNEGVKRKNAIDSLSRELKQALEHREQIEKSVAGTTKPVSSANDALVDHAVAVLDFFEDLAVGIEREVYDEETAKDVLKSALLQFWELLEGFVVLHRTKTNQTSLCEAMERFSEKWQS